MVFRPAGQGISELQIHFGSGYRIYVTNQGEALVIFLAGGYKDSQEQDDRHAKNLARNL